MIAGYKVPIYPVFAIPSLADCFSVGLYPATPGNHPLETTIIYSEIPLVTCPPRWAHGVPHPPCSLGISSCPVLTAPLSHHRYIHTRGSCPVFLWAWSSLLPGLHVAGDPHYLALSSFRFSSDVSPDLHNSSSTHAGGHFLPHFSAYFLRKTSNYPKVYFILNLFFSSLPVSLAYNICKLQTNLHDARRRYCWPLSYSVQCLIRTRPSLNVLWDDWLWVHEINNLKMQFTRRRLPYRMLIWKYGSRLNNKVKRQMLSAKSEIALLKCIC